MNIDFSVMRNDLLKNVFYTILTYALFDVHKLSKYKAGKPCHTCELILLFSGVYIYVNRVQDALIVYWTIDRTLILFYYEPISVKLFLF